MAVDHERHISNHLYLQVKRCPGPAPVQERSVRDHGLYQLCQLKKRLLPAQVAHFHRNDLGYSLLHDGELDPAGDLPQ